MTESARLVITVDSTQTAKAGTDLFALERQASKTEIGINSLAKSAAAAFGALKLGSAISEAVTLASRYDQLGLVMNTVAGNTNRSAVEIAALDGELRKVGISAIQSRNNIIKMMGAKKDLAQATKLARLAQDAAVVGNTNSSEAFERLIKGIQSAEKETLETLGLNVNFQQSYEKLAAQLGKNSDQLTTTEKTQAGVNAAMEAGKNIAGAYEASLGNAGKQLQSSTRYLEDLKVSLGAAGQPAFGLAVDGYVGSLKFLNENVGAVTQALETGLFIALGRGVTAVAASTAAFARDVIAKQAAATASLALAEAEAVEAASNLRATTQRHAAFASHVEVTAATNTNAAAQLRLAAAQKESSVAGAAAMGVGGRLLGIMGGPLGLAVTAGAVALSFVDWSKSANDAKHSAVDLSPSIEALTDKWVKLGAAQRTALGNDLQLKLTESKQNILDLSAQVEKSYNDMGNVKGLPIESWLAPLREFRAAAASGGEGIGDFTQALLDGVPAGSELRVKVEELAAKIEREREIALKASDALKILEDQTKNNAAANAALSGSTDQVGLKYLEQLKKQADFAGKLTEVEKVRISISKGYAGTLSETDQKAALAYAGTVDKANAATAATKTLTSETNKHATAVENQAKALKDFEAQSAISAKSSNDMADAYLSGAGNVRELAIQQKIEEELLKTGAAAHDKVTEAVNKEADAKDRLDIDQSIASMRVETTNTLAQATATLQGKDALEAFNIQKSMSIALSGKKIDIGSKEYEQLLEQTKAQLDANKALEQAGKVEGIVDRLNPQIKLLKDYTAEQDALNAAIQRYPENAALYQDALAKLGREYEVNQSKATIWGQLTEGAVDRIDGVFADAWANIGSGAGNLWDNLVKGAKQAFGEIAHMLTTKPLLASISNWLTGTDNGQGIGSVWSKLLGSAGGSSGSGSSGGFGGMASLGKNLYSAWNTVTGVGSSVASGYASGGVSGALSGGAGYYGNMLASIGNTLSNGFTSLASTITGTTAVQTAATIGAQGVTSAALSGAVTEGAAAVGAQFATGAATTTAATYAAAEAGATATAASLGGQISAALSSAAAMWPLAVVMGMYQSGKLYDSGVRPDAGEIRDSAGSTTLGKVAMAPGAATSKFFEGLDGALGKVVGGKWAAILSGSTLHQAVTKYVGEKLFGTGYQTKDTGLALDVQSGVFDAQSYQDQKKKGGWISGSSKKRTLYGDLPQDTMDVLGDSYNDTVLQVGGLFSNLGVVLSESVLDGLNMPQFKISTKDKTEEEIQAQLDIFFTALGNEAVFAISQATNAGLSGFTFEGLQVFFKNLQDVNGVLSHVNVGLFDMTASGGFMAEQLSAWAGGLDALKTSVAGYYDKFFSDTEKATNTLADVTEEFKNLGIVLPESRQGYRDMVEGIDKTTEAGRAMFLTLTGLSGDASAAYDILKQRADSATEAAKTLANTLAETLNGAVTGAMGAVQRAVAAGQKEVTKAYNDRNNALNELASTATENVSGLTSVGNDLSAALKALRGDSDDAVKMLRAQAQATLQSALATARSGGSLSGFTGLSDALDTVSNNNTDLYSSMEDFARDQGRTANVVAELNAVNGKQLTAEEQLLASAQDQIKQAKYQFDDEMAKFDQQLELAQLQIDALNGVDNSVIGVGLAMSGLSAAITAALAAKPAGSAAANTSANNSTLLDAVYQSVLGRDVDKEGAAYWGGLLQSGGIDYAGLVAAITKDAKANGELPKFATGGLISGPGTGTSDSIFARLSAGEYVLRAAAVSTYGTGLLDQMNSLQLPAFARGGDVGEVGPQLEVTGPSRIYNANQTAAMLKGGVDSGATAAEVRELRREMESNATYMAQLTKAVADGIDTLVHSGMQIIGTVDTKAVA